MYENQVTNQENNTTTMNSNNMQSTSETATPFMNSTSVPPISELRVEATSFPSVINQNMNHNEEFSVSSSGSNGQNSNEPPKNNKISTVLLILLFLFLFGFVMGMPYIRDFIQELKADTGLSEIEKEAKEEEEKQKQEEESKKPAPTPEDEKTKELVCTSNSSVIGNYTLVKTQKFYYNSKDKVLRSKAISNYSFTVVDNDYHYFKQQCDENSLKYLTHEGYTMACSYGDTEIEIAHEFELKTFTPIMDGTTNIQANATYQQDINQIKANLISQGYTCQ